MRALLLASTGWAGLLVVFALTNGGFECSLHGFSSCGLDLLFHLGEAGVCIQFDLQRYCDVHERFLPVFVAFLITVAASLSFFNPR
jgi:hypothetical protein